MSASQVQRKLEFPVRKSRRSNVKNTEQTSQVASKSLRSRRRRTVNAENVEPQETEQLKVKPILTSPRKRHSDDEENVDVTQTNIHSPSKKVKESKEVVIRRDETPIRGSLALKLAKVKVTEEELKENVRSPQKNRLVLSPIKRNHSNSSSPVKCIGDRSPLKRCLALSPVKTKTASPVKKGKDLLSSPQKSPSLKLVKQDCSAYHQAKQSFHTAKPKRLVGRDKETNEVHAFLKDHMTKKTSGSLYISGAPGTGKTAVLTHILEELKAVHKCKTVYLNCMTLDSSSAVYGKLYTDITGKNAPTAKERLRAVEKVLTSEGPSIVMVLDEIDQLDSRNQEILYTIFEWPALAKSRLILVGIANALDLTDRVLPRLQARPKCKPQLLNFAPYTKEQICEILKDRIKDLESEGVNVMDGTAIQFCARKISAVAGDMRKALDVCRRAVELVETSVKSQRVMEASNSATPRSPVKHSVMSPAVPKKIGVVHINNVLSEVYGSGATSRQQETIPLQQKLVVCSLLLQLKQGKMKEVTAGKLHEVYCKVCRNRQMSPVDQTEFQGIVTLLEARGMLGLKKAKESRLMKVTLKLDEKELERTMQDKVLMSTILSEGLPK